MSQGLFGETQGTVGFAGGILASMAAMADTQGLQETALYALVGAVVSYMATFLCKWCFKQIKQWLTNEVKKE